MQPSHEPLLAALRTAAAQKHLLPLALLPQPRPHPRAAFEVYQYEERIDVEAVEQRMQQEILRGLNQHLLEEECARLRMEAFALEEAVEIEENEIAIIRLQIEAERANAKMAAEQRMFHLRHEARLKGPELEPVVVSQEQEEGDLKDNSRLAIYPCFRVEVDPPRRTVPLLPIPANEEHPRSHRQLHAIYTKRSLASSQEHPNVRQAQTMQPPSGDRRTKEGVAGAQEKEASLLGLQRQIAFLERAWQHKRAQGEGGQCGRIKRQLMQLIGEFWQATK